MAHGMLTPWTVGGIGPLKARSGASTPFSRQMAGSSLLSAARTEGSCSRQRA